jgi:RecA/RadA recombinase
MAAKKTANQSEEVVVVVDPGPEKVAVEIPTLSFSLDDLINKAKSRFDKKSLLNKTMKTADEITLSHDRKDYITNDEIVKFWKPLTGIWGLPFGRIVQIAGKADSGKSSTSLLFQKAAQEMGCLVILWDSEGKFDSKRFKDRMGGRPELIPTSTTRNIVHGAQQTVAYVKAAKELKPSQRILIVWDSVGGSVNSAETEENDDFSRQPGVTAREVSWAIRRFNQLIDKYRDQESGEYTVAVLCINQVYANIGSVGNKQKGGGELEYLSSLILEMTRFKTLTRQRQGQRIKYGITTRTRVAKNHLFGGEDCVSEMVLAVSAGGITLEKELTEDVAIDEDDGPAED